MKDLLPHCYIFVILIFHGVFLILHNFYWPCFVHTTEACEILMCVCVYISRHNRSYCFLEKANYMWSCFSVWNYIIFFSIWIYHVTFSYIVYHEIPTWNNNFDTVCRKCITKKLVDDEEECCPICKTDLGCSAADKLRFVYFLFYSKILLDFNIGSLYQLICTCTGLVAFITDQGCMVKCLSRYEWIRVNGKLYHPLSIVIFWRNYQRKGWSWWFTIFTFLIQTRSPHPVPQRENISNQKEKTRVWQRPSESSNTHPNPNSKSEGEISIFSGCNRCSIESF